MGYEKYGIPRSLVERAKAKMKNRQIKQKVTEALDGITKYDLQDPRKVRALMSKMEKITGIHPTETQKQAIVTFVIDQKIAPNNTFHLIRLWGMFR